MCYVPSKMFGGEFRKKSIRIHFYVGLRYAIGAAVLVNTRYFYYGSNIK